MVGSGKAQPISCGEGKNFIACPGGVLNLSCSYSLAVLHESVHDRSVHSPQRMTAQVGFEHRSKCAEIILHY